MAKTDETRRNFLIGAAAGGAVVAGAALVGDSANAQEQAETGAANTEQHAEHENGLGAFFNAADAATVAAFAERLMPGAPGIPGATDANVLNYIDLALAGAYADLQDFYRRGIDQLDGYCDARFGSRFVALSAEQQDEIITALEMGSAEGFTYPSARAFFGTLRTHTMEGMFADPVYGGNKDFAGWKLIGFPGAQPTFTPADLASTDAYAGPSIIGLQSTTPSRRG
jgi:gluconate 2-dehydrogenase gamma chain